MKQALKNGPARKRQARAILEGACADLGLTGAQLAARLGLHPSVVSRWKRGRRTMSQRDRLAIEALRRNKP